MPLNRVMARIELARAVLGAELAGVIDEDAALLAMLPVGDERQFR